MCAIPFPFKSMLMRVVGFVLAAMLRKVRGSERYDEDDREGEGEGGVLGGNGRTEASSSASKALGDHKESRAKEERSTEMLSSPYDRMEPRNSSSSYNDMVLRFEKAAGSNLG